MQIVECREQNTPQLRMILHSSLRTLHSDVEPTGRLALPWGGLARQFTKLLLSLLSHAGRKMVGRHGAAPCSAV